MCNHRRLAGWVAPILRPDLPGPIARDGVQHTWRSYSRTLQRVVIGSASARAIRKLVVPVHLVVGTRDGVPDRTLLEELARRYDHVSLDHWRGGHDLPLTDPARCVALVRAAVQTRE